MGTFEWIRNCLCRPHRSGKERPELTVRKRRHSRSLARSPRGTRAATGASSQVTGTKRRRRLACFGNRWSGHAPPRLDPTARMMKPRNGFVADYARAIGEQRHISALQDDAIASRDRVITWQDEEIRARDDLLVQ